MVALEQKIEIRLKPPISDNDGEWLLAVMKSWQIERRKAHSRELREAGAEGLDFGHEWVFEMNWRMDEATGDALYTGYFVNSEQRMAEIRAAENREG